VRDFRGLAVWKNAHLLVLDIYRITEAFPKQELFGLTSQIRRAAASIPTNIAEGCGRDGDAELGRFLSIAKVRRLRSNISFSWLGTLITSNRQRKSG
jgi:23S rRNA-intervening sequence protein